MRRRFSPLPLLAVLLLLAACSPHFGPPKAPLPATPKISDAQAGLSCPRQLANVANCFTPYGLRVAYGVESLYERGLRGKGQTVVIVDSFGSPTLQQDVDTFDRAFNLPAITVQQLAPIGTVPFDQHNQDMLGWADETVLDVEMVHAIAPDAAIVVLTSPVSETEGTAGLPEFLKLEQYAVTHALGQVVSQSWGASEVSLADSDGQALIHQFADFYQDATTHHGVTFLTASGDNGATDYTDATLTALSPTRTIGFPGDVPWVTTAGGTELARTGQGYTETAWTGSGGGVSKFFTEPDFQRGLPPDAQALLGGQRADPDIAAVATAPGPGASGLATYRLGRWVLSSGTSSAAPLWAAVVAIGDEMAGHPLGFINPALYTLGTSSAFAQDFRDITAGNNTCCGTHGAQPVQGYPAGPGWDAVTGWGAPQADKLLPDLIAATK